MENYTTDDGQIVEYYSDFEETFCKFLKGYILLKMVPQHRLGFTPLNTSQSSTKTVR